jgi:hypothetical protein
MKYFEVLCTLATLREMVRQIHMKGLSLLLHLLLGVNTPG